MNNNLKILCKIFFNAYGWVQGGKTKMAHKFFVTKATDLKIIFLNVETCHDICLKKQNKKYILSPFFVAFFQPSLAPKLLKLSV